MANVRLNSPELSGDTIAIIAGNGALPYEIADELIANERKVLILGIGEDVDRRIADYPHKNLDWGQLSDFWAILKKTKSKDLVFAGGYNSRPPISKILFDWDIIKELPHIISILAAGDNSLISGVLQRVEKKGFKVWGAHELAPGLLVHQGANTPKKPSGKDQKSLALGLSVTRQLGKFDVGQAAVIVGRRAVALEGAEGTDAMLQRVRSLRESGRIPAKIKGVLVKSLKPNQDLRADLPTIGPNTVKCAVEAGLSGIGVEAGCALIVSRAETLAAAKQAGLFIYGIDASDEPEISEV